MLKLIVPLIPIFSLACGQISSEPQSHREIQEPEAIVEDLTLDIEATEAPDLTEEYVSQEEMEEFIDQNQETDEAQDAVEIDEDIAEDSAIDEESAIEEVQAEASDDEVTEEAVEEVVEESAEQEAGQEIAEASVPAPVPTQPASTPLAESSEPFNLQTEAKNAFLSLNDQGIAVTGDQADQMALMVESVNQASAEGNPVKLTLAVNRLATEAQNLKGNQGFALVDVDGVIDAIMDLAAAAMDADVDGVIDALMDLVAAIAA